MSNGFDLQQLWDATDNGLQFFQDEFSHVGKKRNSLKGFSVRTDDKTGSCHVSKGGKQDLYYFNDFGTSDKPVNAIDYVMQRDNCEFVDACKTLFQQFGLPLPKNEFKNPTTFSKETKGKKLGYWHVEFKKEVEINADIKRIFPFATKELLAEYDFKAIEFYEKVGKKENGELYLMRTEATADFPIYGYDKKDFVKLYQPKAPKGDKYLLKHGFIGTKPERIIYGWDNTFKDVDTHTIDYLIAAIKEATDAKERNKLRKELNEEKLNEVIIATGGSDGINIASLGYKVIWFNSESEVITNEEFYELQKIAKRIIYVPDLDVTGVRQAIYVGLQNIELQLLWLPEWIKEKGKKDAADWIRTLKAEPIEKVQSVFKKMLSQTLNFKFWQFSEKGAVQLNEKKLLHFLKHHNIALYKTPYMSKDSGKEDDGYFVNIEKNIIKQIFPSDVKRVVLEWLDKNFHSIDVYNKVIRSTFFNQNQLKALPIYEYKKNSQGKDFQYYFFKNKAVKITAEEIKAFDYSKSLKVNVWEEDVIKRDFEISQPFFNAYVDDMGQKRINILDTSSNYFKVLINTSRVYWEKDADESQIDKNPFGINSENLTDEENAIQEVHLLNKMYCVGYALHQYKRASKAYMLLGVDFKAGENVRGSYGGTGKSFLQKALFNLLNAKNIGAKRLKDDNFPFDGVTPKTRYVLLDDLPMYQDMQYFYNMITDDFIANQKGGVKYNIPFDDSAKVGATTNFAPEMTPSTSRRLLVYHNSDYYHEATEENGYLFSRSIKDDFNNRDLFDKEYKQEEWNADYNFMLQCLQFYLSQNEKVEAPLGNILSRNWFMKCGVHFTPFFRDFFNDESNLNTWIEKSTISDLAKEELGKHFQSPQNFTKRLEYYRNGKLNEDSKEWETLEFKKQKNEKGNSVMHFRVVTSNVAKIEATPQGETTEKEPDTDLPF